MNAEKEGNTFLTPNPGNVDLLNTIPLPDSVANAGTSMPKNIEDHEGAEFESKEFANLITSTELKSMAS